MPRSKGHAVCAARNQEHRQRPCDLLEVREGLTTPDDPSPGDRHSSHCTAQLDLITLIDINNEAPTVLLLWQASR